MPAFLPARASPPATPRRHAVNSIANLSSLDTTTSSANTLASSALAGLTAKDVELIDEIIERSPPTATTFLTVFKAYNEILHERGIDAANDVVYYKLLLKLGVVKGHDWGTKWKAVKAQLGYEDMSTPRIAKTASAGGVGSRGQPNPVPILARQPIRVVPPPSTRRPLSSYGRDSLTVHSHQDDGATESEATDDQTETADETEASNDFASSPTTLIQRDVMSNLKENTLGLSTDTSRYPPLPTIDQFLPVSAKQAHSGYHVTSEASTETSLQSSTSATPYAHMSRVKATEQTGPSQRTEHHLPFTRYTDQFKNAVKPLKDKSFNDEDTWKKIRMIRDEKEADKFREVMLMERCWRVWRGGLDWVKSMNENVTKQRERSLLRNTTDRWRARLALRQREYNKVSECRNAHILRRSLEKWRKALKSRKIQKWREKMRRKMAHIREAREQRILAEAWNSWKTAHRCEQGDLKYQRKLMARMFARWRLQLANKGMLEDKANEFLCEREKGKAIDLWDHWKHVTDLREIGKEVSLRVDSRLIRHALETWKDKLSEKREADVFHDYHIVRNVLATWKGRLSKLRMLERKADKYQKRRDLVLVSAILRVWTSRERGLLLERAILSRRLQSAWVIWKTRLHNLRLVEEYAISFSNRPSMSLASKALHHWHKQTRIQQRLFVNAVQYDELHLMHRMLTAWRIELRMKLRLMKQARIARSYLLIRQAWNKWKDILGERRRWRKLQLLETRLTQRLFIKWHQTAARQRNLRAALKLFEAKTNARILCKVLNKWTDWTIVLKNRELDIIFKRNEERLRRNFTKWKAVYKRHTDDLRLMQSYLYVKREDTMRRMFHRWLSAAKTSCHRRLILQEREEELRLNIMEKAWDAWREKFKAERLKPLEQLMTIQLQKQRLYQAFLVWHAKTRSIPAIRFHSTTTKAKFWRLWRDAMPRALQAKRAREQERKKVLARALDKWAQAYRTKIALKAVARARYLRLPSGAPRQSLPLSSALSGILKTSQTISSTRIAGRSHYATSRSSRASEADIGEDAFTNDPEMHSACSSPARQQPPLRAVQLAIPKLGGPLHTDGETSDLWKALRRAHRRPPSEPS